MCAYLPSAREDHVDVGIAAAGAGAASDDDKGAVLAALVAQVMAVGAALGPGGTVARAQDGSAVVLDEHRFTFQHHQELVLPIVPVALRRPGAGLQDHVADTEVGEAAGRRKAAVPAARDCSLKGGG